MKRGGYIMWGALTQMRYRHNTITWAHYTCGPIICQPKDPLATWGHPGVRVDSRGPVTCPRHINATQVPPWARVALPRGLACHVASARVPRRATSACGSCGRITPFFPFLKRIKSVKIKINSGKIEINPGNSEINIFENITPLILKFSPLAHKFIHLISCHLKYKLKEGYKMNLK